MNLKGQNIFILGAGRSGRAASMLALREGATVSVYDEAPLIHGFPLTVQLFPNITEYSAVNIKCDLLIISPGIDTYGSLVEAFSKNAKKVTGEMQFAWNYYSGFTVAITGTNGKTTTTELIYEILSKNNLSCLPCGNYGTPLSEIILLENQPRFIALEASSFQLETIDNFKPQISIWLNFAPDHMDRYPNVESYFHAKSRIFENQTSDDIAIIRYGEILSNINAKTIHFSTENLAAEWFSDGFVIQYNSVEIVNIEKQTQLRGSHNAENLMASLIVAQKIGISIDDAINAITHYVTPSHRCELVRSLHGVEYLNDSKATNIHALETALRSQTRTVVLIAGGKDKGLDYRPILPLLKEKVTNVITFGQIAEPLSKLFSQAIPSHITSSLEEAVNKAQQLATSGSTILFSPGTSSFDMFTGYENRGDTFKTIVNNLK
jgi:UDP-N-acetylmuramoylalanine--D-glutamate ligase